MSERVSETLLRVFCACWRRPWAVVSTRVSCHATHWRTERKLPQQKNNRRNANGDLPHIIHMLANVNCHCELSHVDDMFCSPPPPILSVFLFFLSMKMIVTKHFTSSDSMGLTPLARARLPIQYSTATKRNTCTVDLYWVRRTQLMVGEMWSA